MSKTLNTNHWRRLGDHQGQAASTLRHANLARASVGRSYYAAYSLLTAELIDAGTTQFGHFRNPHHDRLPAMVRNSITRLRSNARKEVARSLTLLRSLRVDADYRPSIAITDEHAGLAARELANILQELERK